MRMRLSELRAMIRENLLSEASVMSLVQLTNSRCKDSKFNFKVTAELAELANKESRQFSPQLMFIFIDRYGDYLDDMVKSAHDSARTEVLNSIGDDENVSWGDIKPKIKEASDKKFNSLLTETFQRFASVMTKRLVPYLTHNPKEKNTIVDEAKASWTMLMKRLITWEKLHRSDVLRNASSYKMDDGFYWTELTSEEEKEEEGEKMQHCGLSYGQMWSLRDSNNKPHMTAEVFNGEVVQLRGKQNSTPNEKYWKYLPQFLKDKKFNPESLGEDSEGFERFLQDIITLARS